MTKKQKTRHNQRAAGAVSDLFNLAVFVALVVAVMVKM
jgi:hypothetical protein